MVEYANLLLICGVRSATVEPNTIVIEAAISITYCAHVPIRNSVPKA